MCIRDSAKVKHVILLSDGEAPYDGLVELVQDMRSARITVSVVGVTGADRNLLSMIADNGDGRLYMTDDIGALPRIFMKETTEAQKSQLVEDAIKVRVAKRVEAIEGVAIEAAPPLHGYVTTKPKPTAEVILVSDLGEPILARRLSLAGRALRLARRHPLVIALTLLLGVAVGIAFVEAWLLSRGGGARVVVPEAPR